MEKCWLELLMAMNESFFETREYWNKKCCKKTYFLLWKCGTIADFIKRHVFIVFFRDHFSFAHSYVRNFSLKIFLPLHELRLSDFDDCVLLRKTAGDEVCFFVFCHFCVLCFLFNLRWNIFFDLFALQLYKVLTTKVSSRPQIIQAAGLPLCIGKTTLKIKMVVIKFFIVGDAV